MKPFGTLKVISSAVSNFMHKSNYTANNLSPFIKLISCNGDQQSTLTRQIHTSLPRCTMKPRDRKDLLRNIGKIDEGTIGEHTVSVDARIQSREDMFVDERTPHLLFNGVPFSDVPICNVKVSKNNTIMIVTDPKGKAMVYHSCGIEGFKKCRKGTNVAAQATAITLCRKAIRAGIKDVRLKIRGLGPGRIASVKGLQMGGLNIISITDDTRVCFRLPQRPQKQRRI